MTLDLLKPATGQAKRPSEIRENMQYILGAALPDCILPNADGTFGGKITVGSNLAVDVSGFRSIIAGKYHEIPAFAVNTTARRAQLLYATKNAANDSVTPTIGVLTAVFPAADAGTVCRYIVDGGATVANTATDPLKGGIITKSGTITAVDGWANDYAGKGDGATGYYVSANNTGFPLSASVRQFDLLVTINSIAAQTFLSYGGSDVSPYIVSIGMDSSGNFFVSAGTSANALNTGFVAEVGKTYYLAVQYNGTQWVYYINGLKVAALTCSINTTAGNLNILRYFAGSQYSTATLYYVELRNTLRTPAQIASISNALLLACRYELPANTDMATSTQAISEGDNASCPKGNAYDNNVGTYWASSQTGTGVNGVAAIGQNFGASVTIAAASIVQVDSMTAVNSVKAQKSSNGTEWTDIGTYAVTKGTTGGIAQMLQFVGSHTAQYFRLLANDSTNTGNSWCVYEVEFISGPTSTYSDIRSVLPADSISLGFVRTDATKIIEADDSSYKYGRREGAVGGNRNVFLGWKYFNCANNITWNNAPFGTRKYKASFVGATDANGSNETIVPALYYVGTAADYGTYVYAQTADKIVAYNTAMTGLFSLNGTWQTSGYIGCYAEVIE